MKSDEISWLDRVKEYKWVIFVAAICLFAGISYLSTALNPTGDSTASAPSTSDSSYQTPTATPTPTSAATETAQAAPSPKQTFQTASAGTNQQAPEPGDWKPTATAFAKAWANPKVGKDAWLAALKPTVTPDLYDSFTSTDVRRMTQLEVADIRTDSEDYAGVNATVSFKNTTFTVQIHLMAMPDMSWRVSVVTT